jgi:phage I-like protein
VAARSALFRCSGEAAGLPQRIKILHWGRNPVRPGGEKIILVDETTAATLTANQDAMGIDRVPMDYEHQSFPGHKNYQPDPRHSPGSGRIEVIPGEGVFLSAIEYTPNGVEHAASYRDVSAVVRHDASGRALLIECVALTQTGAVAGAEFTAALSATHPPTSMENQDDPAKRYRATLIQLLSLKPKPESGGEISDEEILDAATRMIEQRGGITPAAASGDTEALSARIIRLETAEDTRVRERLLLRATAEGKRIPLSAEVLAQTPIAVLSAMVDGLTPGEVPTGSGPATTEKPGTGSDHTTALSVDEKAAAAALGLTEAEYAKAKI